MRCRINKDTERQNSKKAIDAHCLITEDTVNHGEGISVFHSVNATEVSAVVMDLASVAFDVIVVAEVPLQVDGQGERVGIIELGIQSLLRPPGFVAVVP